MAFITFKRSSHTSQITYSRTPTIGSVVTGLPEMVLGVGFFITWVNPEYLGPGMVKFALELMLLEFILIHSSPFMGFAAVAGETVAKRTIGFIALGAFYSLFVVGFCLSLDTWRPMATFWIGTAQRLGAELLDPKPSGETKAWYMGSVALNVVLYLGFVFATLFLPVPQLGVTTAVRNSLGLTMGGAWPSEPQRVVVLAGLYYFFRGWATARAFPRTIGPAPKRA